MASGRPSQATIRYTCTWVTQRAPDSFPPVPAQRPPCCHTHVCPRSFSAEAAACCCRSALRGNARLYLMCRAVQFFTPGIPMVYTVGLLFGKNDWAVRPPSLPQPCA